MKPHPPAGYVPPARPAPPPGYSPVTRIALKSEWPLPDRPEPPFCYKCASWIYQAEDTEAFCARLGCPERARCRRAGKA